MRKAILGMLLLLWSGCAPHVDTVAPIVIQRPTIACEIDPSVEYVRYGVDKRYFDVYRLSTGELIREPRANSRVYYRSPSGSDTLFWSDPGVLFVGIDTIPEPTSIAVYEDGWFFDFNNNVFTDVLDLPPAEREQVLEDTNAKLHAARSSTPPYASPNGALLAHKNAILRNTGWPDGPYEELVAFAGEAEVCQNGWKPDSTGVYIVERKGAGGMDGGPIRLLRVPEEYLTPTPAAK